MRSSVHAGLMIGLLLVLCFCSACTSQSPAPEQAGATSATPGTPTQIPGLSPASPDRAGSVSFNEAMSGLYDYNPQMHNASPFDKQVYRMQGNNIDASGRALTWTFTTSIGDTGQVLTYDGAGWRNASITSANLPAGIDFSRIIPPAELFSRNQQTLFSQNLSGPGVTRDLDLTGSLYTVTMTSAGDLKVYRFNATTGVLIS